MPANDGLNSNYRYTVADQVYRPGNALWCTQEGAALTLPIIDLAIIDLGSPAEGAGASLARIAAEVGAACRDVGFFYVVNHGVAPELIAKAFAQSHDFFALPVAVSFTAPASGASATLSATSAATDASGHASVTAVANTTTGSYAVTASVTLRT